MLTTEVKEEIKTLNLSEILDTVVSVTSQYYIQLSSINNSNLKRKEKRIRRKELYKVYLEICSPFREELKIREQSSRKDLAYLVR